MDIEQLADVLDKASDSMAHDHVEIGAAIIQTTHMEVDVPEGPVVDLSNVAKEMPDMADRHKDTKTSMQEHVKHDIVGQLLTGDAASMATRALGGIEGAWSILFRAQGMGAWLPMFMNAAACQLDEEGRREGAPKPEDISYEDKIMNIMRRMVKLADNYIKAHGGQQPTASGATGNDKD